MGMWQLMVSTSNNKRKEAAISGALSIIHIVASIIYMQCYHSIESGEAAAALLLVLF
jgi:hypothetical protein